MSRLVIIQHIQTTWTKEARGGAEAIKRNSVPEKAILPIAQIETERNLLSYHQLVYCETSSQNPGGFMKPWKETISYPNFEPFGVGCVNVRYGPENVIASFQYHVSCGAPRRGWARKTMTLAPGEWGQFIYNGRLSYWEDNWNYQKTVVNVGLFDILSSHLFTESEPNHRFSAMAHLF